MDPRDDASLSERGGESESTVPLSSRETEVLRLLAQGQQTQEIADQLGIRRVTARNHISHILTKLGVQSRLQAVLRASEMDLIQG